ncbi:hypothetical protein SLE2022_057910 [Rubroshorea leprosula]
MWERELTSGHLVQRESEKLVRKLKREGVLDGNLERYPSGDLNFVDKYRSVGSFPSLSEHSLFIHILALSSKQVRLCVVADLSLLWLFLVVE